jgi:hypothetical protein
MSLLTDLERRLCPHCLDHLAATVCDECGKPSCRACLENGACPRCTTCPICYAEVDEEWKPCCSKECAARLNAAEEYEQQMQAHKDRPLFQPTGGTL